MSREPGAAGSYDLPGYNRTRARPSQSPRVASMSHAMLQVFRQLKYVVFIAVFLLFGCSAYLALFTSRLNGILLGPQLPVETLSGLALSHLAVPLRNDTSRSRRLRIFMPADAPHINLCKTVMSAVALGYPLPTLLNWHGEYNRPSWHFAGSHIAKLVGLLGGIEALLEDGDDAGEDDIAVLVDAYDIWFQLQPSVLIQRYHQINREADERARKQWEEAGWKPGFPVRPPRQDIVVTSAKDCFPDGYSGSDPHYEHWPASPMPADMYGPGTDEVPFSLDSARKYRRVRPRCVNSGMIMGTMGGLREALRRCKEKVDAVERAGRQLWSDQALLAEVIGDQEMWREWARHLSSSWDGQVALNDVSSLSPDVRPIAAAALGGRRFEFGIGLDYNFTTMPPTCSAEEDGFFVKTDDKAAVKAESDKAGVPAVRVHGIPPELRDATTQEDPLLSGFKWGQLPLYTDFFFGTTPVGIHHNAYVGGLKPWRLAHWWHNMWYYPQLRQLVTQRLRSNKQDAAPLATIPSQPGQDSLVYWAPQKDHQHRAVTVFEPSSPPGDQFSPISWDGVCQKNGESKKWYDELFGDADGPLDI
ncbi:hypothetical protein EDB81DRAFT_879560 [Dactylonectria macrodidyma]|uniref:Uncharacterized protein n=1 Tax=Dactylonectria macrodidyma TaxID=307937 RepID=A0A9P9JDA4_9HYPO|nr:hypothetical protein EDB81DRAFT_879560 [Dactylonectria macrodidyma]